LCIFLRAPRSEVRYITRVLHLDTDGRYVQPTNSSERLTAKYLLMLMLLETEVRGGNAPLKDGSANLSFIRSLGKEGWGMRTGDGNGIEDIRKHGDRWGEVKMGHSR
jgi:hypothetical protein